MTRMEKVITQKLSKALSETVEENRKLKQDIAKYSSVVQGLEAKMRGLEQENLRLVENFQVQKSNIEKKLHENMLRWRGIAESLMAALNLRNEL